MFKILSALVFFSSLQALANPACLAQVSNAELVREISNRLGNSSPLPGGNGAILTVNCDAGGTLNLRTVNPTTGAQKSTSAYIGSSSCGDYVYSLLQVSNVSLSRNLLVSHCDAGGTLYKTLVGVDGNMTAVSSDYMGSSKCKQAALDANSRLSP
jgi:hypothetical protein